MICRFQVYGSVVGAYCDLDMARTQMPASSAVKPSRYCRWMTSQGVNCRIGMLRIKLGTLCSSSMLRLVSESRGFEMILQKRVKTAVMA